MVTAHGQPQLSARGLATATVQADLPMGPHVQRYPLFVVRWQCQTRAAIVQHARRHRRQILPSAKVYQRTTIASSEHRHAVQIQVSEHEATFYSTVADADTDADAARWWCYRLQAR